MIIENNFSCSTVYLTILRMAAFRRKYLFIVPIIMFQIIYIGSKINQTVPPDVKKASGNNYMYDRNWRNLSSEQISNMSVLGKILFNGESIPEARPKYFTILVWNSGPKIEPRHLYRYGKDKHSPWEGCTVDNCEVTYSKENFQNADAVLFPIQFLHSVKQMPTSRPNFDQLWIILSDESPMNTFHGVPGPGTYNGLFNWTMNYRMDSDVPVPYGRTLLIEEKGNYIANISVSHERTNSIESHAYVTIAGSNCGGSNQRWNYVRELQKYIPVDIYGHCGPLKCNQGKSPRYGIDCSSFSEYEFYLSFENSNCDEYVTEKVWWNAYTKNLVPIVMGTSVTKCKQLLPPMSYIHVDEFKTPEHLADHLKFLHANRTEYNKYFEWKKRFVVRNEHGYFGSQSYHYCRLCEALNYNNLEHKVYDDLESVWGVHKYCTGGNKCKNAQNCKKAK